MCESVFARVDASASARTSPRPRGMKLWMCVRVYVRSIYKFKIKKENTKPDVFLIAILNIVVTSRCNAPAPFFRVGGTRLDETGRNETKVRSML